MIFLEAENDGKGAGKDAGNGPEIDGQKGVKDNASSSIEDYKRLGADFDNYRKQADRAILSAKSRGASDVAKEELAVLDDFDSAIAHYCENGEVCGGLSSLRNKLFASLSKFGLEEMENMEGKPFDPHLMEAVKTDEKVDEGIVASQLRKGYAFEGEIIRHPMVIVGSKKPNGK